jgi:lipopolysaccharide transport system ATP-binding protein
MAAIQNLCNKGLMLENGLVKTSGNIEKVIYSYLQNDSIKNQNLSEIKTRNGNGNLRVIDGKINSISGKSFIETFDTIEIELHFNILKEINIFQYKIDVGINNYLGDRIAWLSSDIINNNFNILDNKITFEISNLPLAPGDYTVNIYSEINNEVSDWLTEVLPFRIIEKDYYNTGKVVPENQGFMLLNFNVK